MSRFTLKLVTVFAACATMTVVLAVPACAQRVTPEVPSVDASAHAEADARPHLPTPWGKSPSKTELLGSSFTPAKQSSPNLLQHAGGDSPAVDSAQDLGHSVSPSSSAQQAMPSHSAFSPFASAQRSGASSVGFVAKQSAGALKTSHFASSPHSALTRQGALPGAHHTSAVSRKSPQKKSSSPADDYLKEKLN